MSAQYPLIQGLAVLSGCFAGLFILAIIALAIAWGVVYDNYSARESGKARWTRWVPWMGIAAVLFAICASLSTGLGAYADALQ